MAAFPDVLNNATSELAHAWHPVALIAEVGDHPLQVRLLGETWVILRANDTLMALRDRCPHRNAPLSAGCMVEGAIECPYHGWRFAANGQCVHIPAMGTMKPPRNTAAQVPAGLEERYGLVWLAPKAPRVPIIEIPEWEDSDFRTAVMPPLRTRASAAQIVDNFLDVTHFYYLHGQSFGLTNPDPIRFYEVERGATEVVLHHQTFFSNGSGPLLARLGHYHCTLPYQCRLLAEFPDSRRRDMIALIAQPEDDHCTRIYKLLAYNWTDSKELEEMVAFETRVIQEDVAMTEQLPSPDLPLATTAQAHARGDEIGLAWRQALRQLFRDQHLEEVVSAREEAKSQTQDGDAAPALLSRQNSSTLILWASQTGRAEALAEALADRLVGLGVTSNCLNMDALSAQQLPHWETVICISSTFGDGEPPDNGTQFWAELSSASAPRLERLRYAVLGLGDRSFDTFCAHGRNLDHRLRELGATPLRTRVDAESDDEALIEDWRSSVVAICQGGNTAATASLIASRGRDASLKSRRANPLVRLLHTKRLGHPQDARFLNHCVLDIGGAGLHYQTGDLLRILPENPTPEVNALLVASGFDGEYAVRLNDENMSLREALRAHLDIRRWGQKALEEMVAGENPQQLVDRIRPLQARRYSIASSASAEPNQVHLLVSGNRDEMGLCATYLANLAIGAQLRADIQPNPKFRLPASDIPIIMIAAGSGLAPFRGFLLEREIQGNSGKNWLFFGERHANVDLPFSEEIRRWQRSAHLSRLDTAFSRDQEEPVYVQQRIAEQGLAIWEWVQEGASLYLCGSLGMAKGVAETLQQIAQRYGGLAPDDASAFWSELQHNGRLCKDVY